MPVTAIEPLLLVEEKISSPESLVNDWLRALHAAGRSMRTIEVSAKGVARWLAYARANGLLDDPAFTTGEHLRMWLSALRDEGLKANTIATWSNRCRAWFRWLDEQGEISADPWRRIPRVKGEEPAVHPPGPAAMETILRGLVAAARASRSDWRAVRNVALLAVLFDTGLRAQELLSLRVGDLSREDITVRGKGRRQRVVTLSDNVMVAVRRYVRAYERARTQLGLDDALWQGRLGPLGYAGLYLVVTEAAAAVNVRLHPHLLRHGFANGFLDEGGDRFALQLLLGHASSAQTSRYVSAVEGNRALKQHREHSPARTLKLS